MREYVNKNRILLLILVAGAILRVAAAMTIGFENPYSSPETTSGAVISGGVDSGRPPLYSLFVGIVHGIFGPGNDRAAFVIQGLLSSVVIVLVYGIAARLSGRRAGLTAAAVSMLYPPFVLGNLALDGTPFNIILICLLLSIAASGMDKSRKSMLSALVTGFGILAGPHFIYFIPGMLVVLKRRLIFVAVLVAVLAPSIVYHSVAAGRFVPVYEVSTLEKSFAIKRYARAGGFWRLVDAVYVNASALVNKGWKEERSAENRSAGRSAPAGSPEARYGGSGSSAAVDRGNPESARNRRYLSAYSQLVVMFLGIVGLVKYYRRAHGDVVFPVAAYVLLLIVFSETRIYHRALVEPLLIAYASMHIDLVRMPLFRRR